MSSSGMLRRVALVKSDISEEHVASIIREERISELGTTLAVTSNRSTQFVFLRNVLQLLVTANVVSSSMSHSALMMEAKRSSGSSVLTRATWRNIPEDGILHSHCCENLKSYIALTG
jgi:hypothetical protein